MSEKLTNPKDGLGIRKVPIHAVPMQVLSEVGLAMMEGGRKYGRHNYRDAGVRASVYVDAVWRHVFLQWWEGEDIDEDSNLNHIIKAIASLVVLRDSMLMGNWVDDRPIRHPAGTDIGWLNNRASEIIDKYSDCKPPFTENGKYIGIPKDLAETKSDYNEKIDKVKKAEPNDGCHNCKFNSEADSFDTCNDTTFQRECIGKRDHPNWEAETKSDYNEKIDHCSDCKHWQKVENCLLYDSPPVVGCSSFERKI